VCELIDSARRYVLLGVLGGVAACSRPSSSELNDEDTSSTESGGEDPEPDLDPGPSACEEYDDCPDGSACIDGVCSIVEPLPECPGPTLVPIDLPSQNGHMVAIELADLDQDGDDELLAWNQELGIALLSGDQWLISPYPTPGNETPSLAAMPLDDQPPLDFVLNGPGGLVDLGLADGTGQFQFNGTVLGLELLRPATLEPDRVRAFGRQTLFPFTVAFLRFDALEPTTVELPVAGYDFALAELDAGSGDELIVYSRCTGWALRHIGNDMFDFTEIEIPWQSKPGHCEWLAADLDGDGRDELIVKEPSFGAQATLLSMFANQTESFAARELAQLPSSAYASTPLDLDGNGRDEILYLNYVDAGGTLVWADGDALIDCRASVVDVPQEIIDVRAGDLDGDGDDEIVALRDNGALYVRDAS
jgi:hypothetical protein